MSTSRDIWLAQTRANWNERAPWWDERAEANAASPDRAPDLQRTADALRLHSNASLLDAGCGSGQFAIAFAKLSCRVTAVDLAPEMIVRAQHHARHHGVEVKWRVGDIAQLADPLAVYDAVHARLSLQFVHNLPATLREFRRVLKPGGRLYASVPGALSPIYKNSWRRLLEQGVSVNYATPWELEAILTELGWRLLDSWGEFGQSLDGALNDFAADDVAHLDRRLQQAAATTWAIIAA